MDFNNLLASMDYYAPDYQHNRAMLGLLNDDLTNFHGPLLRVINDPKFHWDGLTNNSKSGNFGAPKFAFDFRYIALFWNAGDSKGLENCGQISDFSLCKKIRERMSEMSESIFQVQSRTQRLVYFWSGLLHSLGDQRSSETSSTALSIVLLNYIVGVLITKY